MSCCLLLLCWIKKTEIFKKQKRLRSFFITLLCGGQPTRMMDPEGLKGGDKPSESLCLAAGNNPASCRQRVPDTKVCEPDTCTTSVATCLEVCFSELNPWWTTPPLAAAGIAGSAARAGSRLAAGMNGVGAVSASWAGGSSVGCAMVCANNPCAVNEL